MEGRVVAITGGASDIGLATAKLLASRGAKISVAGVHQQERLDKAAAEIEQSALHKNDVAVSGYDVRDVAQVATWLKNTVNKFGRLDHVATVAGVWKAAAVSELDEQAWDHVIGVNLTVRSSRLPHHPDHDPSTLTTTRRAPCTCSGSHSS